MGNQLITIIDNRISIFRPFRVRTAQARQKRSAHVIVHILGDYLGPMSLLIPRSEHFGPFDSSTVGEKVHRHDPERLLRIERYSFDHASHFHCLSKHHEAVHWGEHWMS